MKAWIDGHDEFLFYVFASTAVVCFALTVTNYVSCAPR